MHREYEARSLSPAHTSPLPPGHTSGFIDHRHRLRVTSQPIDTTCMVQPVIERLHYSHRHAALTADGERRDCPLGVEQSKRQTNQAQPTDQPSRRSQPAQL